MGAGAGQSLSWFCSAHSRSRDLPRSFERSLEEAGVGSVSLLEEGHWQRSSRKMFLLLLFCFALFHYVQLFLLLFIFDCFYVFALHFLCIYFFRLLLLFALFFTLYKVHLVSSVTQSCPNLCDLMNRSMPGLPVHHQLPEFTKLMSVESLMPSHPLWHKL